MAKNGFPLLKEQQELHKEFIKEITSFVREYNMGAAELTGEIIRFLKDWAINHILQEDKKYKDYLKEQKLSR